MTKQKVLVMDIETAPMLAYVWGLKDQNIALNQIKDEWCVIAWSAKWLGDSPSKIMYMDQRHSRRIHNDRVIIEAIWDLLDEADIVITQNGKNFDSPKLNARFIFYGMKPPSPYKHLDTYQIIRNAAKFTSNKLEYLTNKLCTKYKKLSHKRYPGFSLWTECLAGNIHAWDEMKRYNIHDVLATEEFYNKIKAWAPSSMPDVYINGTKCGTCGKGPLTKQGFDRTKKGVWQQLQCQSCGKWVRGEKISEVKHG